MSDKRLEGKTPAEAQTILLKEKYTGFQTHDLYKFVIDYLSSLPDSEVEILQISNSDITSLSSISHAFFDDIANISIEEWEELERLSSRAMDRVAQINPKHDSLSQIFGRAHTTLQNARRS